MRRYEDSPWLQMIQRMEHPAQCNVCTKLREAANDVLLGNLPGPGTGSVRSQSLGRFEDLQGTLSTSCWQHHEFFRTLRYNRLSPYSGSEEMRIELSEYGLALSSFRKTGDGREASVTLTPLLVLSPKFTQGVGVGRIIDRNNIDFDLVRQWRDFCDHYHGSACSMTQLKMSKPLQWLIDTEDQCLVDGSNGQAYVALSYVWGQTATLKTTRATLSEHRKIGAFRRLTRSIPQTIRDAIALVPHIGVRYLWVDSLCIVQDDDQSLESNINQMATIYENAMLTIVAGDGSDANHGLRGACSSSQPRILEPVLKLSEPESISITGRQNLTLVRSKWATRGWTMQESVFARRKLVFIDNSIRWHCQSGDYAEDVEFPLQEEPWWSMRFTETNRSAYNNLSLDDLSLGFPNMAQLLNLVTTYSHRELTFSEDALPAVSSTLAILERRAFPRGFAYGIPISFFDQALLWRSLKFGGCLIRREASSPSRKCPPSWTWAGWRGRIISYISTTETYIKPSNPAASHGLWLPYQAIPYLEWFTRTTPEEPPVAIPFQNEWYKLKRQYMGKESNLPSGWAFQRETEGSTEQYAKNRSFKNRPGPVAFEEIAVPYYYSHVSVPDVKFWHPVSLGEDVYSATVSTGAKSFGRYLCARTQQARLFAARPRPNGIKSPLFGTSQVIIPMFSADNGVTVVLRDEDDQEIGELEVDVKEDFEQITGRSYVFMGMGSYNVPEDSSDPIGHPCDIVAISRGFDLPEPILAADEIYTFYNVLWIKWDDGIAYRRGLGRVLREAWEKAKKVDIDLILG